MKKLIIFAMLVALSGTLRAQTAGEELGRIDNAIKNLATEMAKKLNQERVETVALGQFPYMGAVTQFNSYLGNQLTGELAGLGGNSFSLVSGGGVSDVVVTGEIVHIGDIVRVYARLVRREGNRLVAQTHTDIEVNQTIASMLSSVVGEGSGILVMPDEWETDSMDAPIEYQAGTAPADATVINRTIQGGDEDWFVISSDRASQLIIETTGDMDTYMTLYDAATRNELSSNDDGSDGSNASIRYFAGAGARYLVMVRGYSSGTTGNYGFRAYAEDMGEATPYEVYDDINEARFVTGRLESGNSLYRLTPGNSGTLVLETSGSNDVFLEFYDADTFTQLASDDDSGYDNNARITIPVERGKSYLAIVRGYSTGMSGQFGFKAYLER